MAELAVNGKSVEVNDEGFLINPADWDREVAEALAQASGISLTEKHWVVIDFCRRDYAENGEAPGVRRITKVGGVPTKDMYALFPGGPGKLAAKLSGLAKPTGCV
jgi:tRNA 2-thiouridine synthesizing protein E